MALLIIFSIDKIILNRFRQEFLAFSVAVAFLLFTDLLSYVCCFQYNGVNLRCATYEQAAKILQESGSNVTILAQYSPQKFLDAQLASSSPAEASSMVSKPGTTKRRSSGSRAADDTVLPLPEKVPLGSNVEEPGEVRVVAFKKKSQSRGFSIVGGNATGVFVSEIEQNSSTVGSSGLCAGDQILEVS